MIKAPLTLRQELLHLPWISGQTLPELADKLADVGFQRFRAEQILDWVHKRFVGSWAEMKNLPKDLQSFLEKNFKIKASEQVLIKSASDVTQKYLLRQADGSLIEAVFIRYPQRGVGVEGSRRTICVSSQVGCAYGCRFCASGLLGWKRHLSAGEIVEQVLHVCRTQPLEDGERLPFDNIVFMGMGEPLANYDQVLKAITILNAPWGCNFGGRRITISTSGLVPEIYRLAEEPISFRLAVSLHGATNAVRDQIMPINKKYPLDALIPAIQKFSKVKGRMVTLEYILIEDVNDGLDQAQALAKIARDLHAHVNLIPYNKVEGLPWKRPNIMRQKAFHDLLKEKNVSATIRKEKGHDIAAACGQLRLNQEKAEGTIP
jgi:23S rRNA (adenine2503-C2)-methyltransferase